jgi:hypothetical protein
MQTLQPRTFLVLLMLGLGTNTAWSGQSTAATPATGSQANALQTASATSDRNEAAAGATLPSIMSEEDIPAFLRTDPCDTGDS